MDHWVAAMGSDERETVARGEPVVADMSDESFRALYQARYVAMVKLATLLVGRVDLAEDVVQDAFSDVFRRWDELDSPGGYLRVAVVNRCHDRFRRDRRAQALPTGTLSVVDAPNELADAVAALPDRQRTAVVLRFYEDMSVDEIARTMNARPGTVKSWLSRAMAKLRQEVPR